MFNILTGLIDIKGTADELDVDRFKTVSIDLEKISDVVSKEVAKKQNFAESWN